jgi:hypothetical protein
VSQRDGSPEAVRSRSGSRTMTIAGDGQSPSVRRTATATEPVPGLLRWLTVPMTPQTLGPPYWILMGATAIIVLAGARILGLHAALAVVATLTFGKVAHLAFMEPLSRFMLGVAGRTSRMEQHQPPEEA